MWKHLIIALAALTAAGCDNGKSSASGADTAQAADAGPGDSSQTDADLSGADADVTPDTAPDTTADVQPADIVADQGLVLDVPPAQDVPDTGADTDASPTVVEGPGQCFEVFGPGVVSHFPPRYHDLGWFTPGESASVDIRFYNFCDDNESTVVGTFILPLEANQPTSGFEIAKTVPVGSKVWNNTITVRFTASEPGFHAARVRFHMTHGWYDIDLAAEVVEAGGAPAKLAQQGCLSVEDAINFPGPTKEQGYRVDFGMGCELVLGAEHVVMVSAAIEGDTDGVFGILDKGHLGGVIAPCWEDCQFIELLPRLSFTPVESGTYTATLVIQTNEAAGIYTVPLSGTLK